MLISIKTRALMTDAVALIISYTRMIAPNVNENKTATKTIVSIIHMLLARIHFANSTLACSNYAHLIKLLAKIYLYPAKLPIQVSILLLLAASLPLTTPIRTNTHTITSTHTHINSLLTITQQTI